MSKTRRDSVRDALVGAAITGLLGGGCGSGSGSNDDDAPREIKSFQVADLTVAKFEQMCADRGGLTQTHASCGGTNACKGLIYNSWAGATVVEHTCRGFNSCLGISCVDLPEDSGLSGQEIYEDTCASCHGGGEEAEDANAVYSVFVAPGGDADAALAKFEGTTDAALVKKAAFGAVGYYEDGTPYSNMPAYHEELSVEELERVVEHLLGLELATKESEVLGINAEVDTSGGAE